MWTEERNELLKKLWADGLSASRIAGRLGGVTRNAVIGKVHRLGLQGRATVTRMRSPHPRRGIGHSPKRPAPTARVPTAACAAGGAIQYELLLLPMMPTTCTAAPVLPPVMELTVSAPLRVDLLDLKECMCRWPIGDPQSKDFHFCGRQKAGGSSYCEHHARIATQPWRRK